MTPAFLAPPTFWTSNLLTAEIKQTLSSADLIITIGNDLRSDDGVGPYIAKHCQSKKVLDAQDKPENIIEEAVFRKPKIAVIIDAADFDGGIGEVRMIKKEQIPKTTLSTHAFPLNIIAQIIENDTGARVHFLGIQVFLSFYFSMKS